MSQHTIHTAHVRADCWAQSLDVIDRGLPSAPLCERLLRGAFNTAEIAIDQSLFRRRLGWSYEACMNQPGEGGMIPAHLIEQAQRLGLDLMLTHDGFTGDPYHEDQPGDWHYAPFPNGGLDRYCEAASWLARTYRPRFYVVLNEPAVGGLVTDARYAEIVRRPKCK